MGMLCSYTEADTLFAAFPEYCCQYSHSDRLDAIYKSTSFGTLWKEKVSWKMSLPKALLFAFFRDKPMLTLKAFLINAQSSNLININ